MPDPLTGRIISGLLYSLAIAACLLYVKQSRRIQLLGLIAPLAYVCGVYWYMAWLSWNGLGVDFLLPFFQIGQWTLAGSLTLMFLFHYYIEIHKGGGNGN